MRNLLVLTSALVIVLLSSCESQSGKRARERSEPKDSVQYSYSAGSVKCVNVSVTAYRNDSVVYYNEMAFVKNSKKATEWGDTESDNVIRYNNNIDSVRVNNREFSVIR